MVSTRSGKVYSTQTTGLELLYVVALMDYKYGNKDIVSRYNEYASWTKQKQTKYLKQLQKEYLKRR